MKKFEPPKLASLTMMSSKWKSGSRSVVDTKKWLWSSEERKQTVERRKGNIVEIEPWPSSGIAVEGLCLEGSKSR